jgi:hypothetical protein
MNLRRARPRVSARAPVGESRCPAQRNEVIMECTNSPARSHTLEQGKARGAEGLVQAQGSLDDPGAPANGEPSARELALFDLGIDSTLRACDLVKRRIRDVCRRDRVASRATVLQQKTQRPVEFEISPATRDAVETCLRQAGLRDLTTTCSRARYVARRTLGTRQYAPILAR